MVDIAYPEWRNGNEHIRYPFADYVSLRNVDGATVDRDLFDDARLYPIGGAAGLFLSRVTVDGNVVTFAVADLVSGELASCSYDATAAPNELYLTDAYGRPAGILVSSAEKLAAALSKYGQGTVEFTQEQTEFVATVAIPMPQPGLRGLLLDDGQVVSGDICLVGADGAVLSVEDGVIRVDFLGDPYALKRTCDEEGAPLPEFCGLKTINGIEPDENGDFKLSIGGNLASDPVLRLAVDSNGQIQLSQVCTSKTGLPP
jgi:hypothetical protein